MSSGPDVLNAFSTYFQHGVGLLEHNPLVSQGVSELNFEDSLYILHINSYQICYLEIQGWEKAGLQFFVWKKICKSVLLQ